jgi:hypothetical protein
MIETVRLGAKLRREVPDKQLEQARSTPDRSAAGNTARLLAQSAVFELAAGSGCQRGSQRAACSGRTTACGNTPAPELATVEAVLPNSLPSV